MWLGILVFFVLEKSDSKTASNAIWLPVIWMLMAGSRPLSEWLGIVPPGSEQNTDGNALDRVVFSGLVLMGVLVLISRGDSVVKLISANKPLILFFGYALVSVLWSDFPAVSLKRWIKAIGDPIMMMVVLSAPNRSVAVKRFFAWTGFVLMPVSILLCKYYPLLGLHFYRDGSKGIVGVATDKNMLGAICLISGLGAVWRILYAFSPSEKARAYRTLIPQIVIFGMVVWLLHSANSMTSIACLTFGSILLIATRFEVLARRRLLIHGLVIVALSAASIPLFLDAAGGVLSAVGRDPTLTQRTELWDEVIKLTPHPVLGAGFESFWLGTRRDILWTKFWWRPNESHNGYIEVFLNLGWIGVSLLALLFVSGYRRVLKLLGRDRTLGGLKLAGLVAGVMYGLTEAGFRMMHPMWVSTLLAAVAIPPSLTESVREAAPSRPARPIRPAGHTAPRPSLRPAAQVSPRFRRDPRANIPSRSR